jgi:predicted deacylase
VVDVVTLGSDNGWKKKKKIYISGALHGDEIIGPNAAYYFIEYMVKNASQPDVK